ncbi:hypothetical protein CH352_00460 [Leptospira hartskeerlii]|uniref:Lipoprotein n=1 Tax=Leptospira hartskeerlii TaxID=2023177 RepID=A0A2M9X9C9_9LEPT|nr:hypothetical protein [Leptospira hartskeerlii]PJZ24152.1 hypothetical protein CH357_17565 [Leptospira hartskeerlii]PJZ35146.1 hypothetical protein CH352_00460 [Leptospira hartskeerlii]
MLEKFSGLLLKFNFYNILVILLALACTPSIDKSPYKELRELAFETEYDDIGVQNTNDKTVVYGIIMDWPTQREIVTLATFLSGDASLFLTSGASFIGGGGRESIQKSSIRFIHKYAYLWKQGKKVRWTPNPDLEQVRFFFLTTQGTYYLEDTVGEIDADTSTLTPIFDEAQAVISEIRIEAEKEKDDEDE